MRFFLISDNDDTAIGLRLAGIDGVVARDRESADRALDACLSDESIAVVLMNESLCELCADRVFELKLGAQRPLIVEIPDRHGGGRAGDSISRYVRDAIGLKID